MWRLVTHLHHERDEEKGRSSLGGSLFLAITMNACGTLPATSVNKKRDPAAVNSSVVQSLQRQIREREKRIADLESQLDALRVIDQDMEKRRTSSQPPATLTPAATDQLR
jgi:hypothetical protein